MLIILLFFSGLFFAIYYLAVWIKYKKSFLHGVFFLLGSVLLLRGIMIWTQFPSAYFRLGVFASSTFSFEWFYSSLGDALLNVWALIVFLIFALFQRDKFDHWIKEPSRRWVAYLFILIGYLTFYLFTDTIQILLAHSQLSLDISNSLDFSLQRLAAYLLISLFGILYFLITYFGFEIFRAVGGNRSLFLRTHFVGLLASGTILYSYDALWLVLSGNLLYQVVVYQFSLPANLRKLRRCV